MSGNIAVPAYDDLSNVVATMSTETRVYHTQQGDTFESLVNSDKIELLNPDNLPPDVVAYKAAKSLELGYIGRDEVPFLTADKDVKLPLTITVTESAESSYKPLDPSLP